VAPDIAPPAPEPVTPPSEPDPPSELRSASETNPAPFVLFGAIVFAMAAAAGQAMRNDPLLLQRLIRGFDGVRRPGGGVGSGGQSPSGAGQAAQAFAEQPTEAGLGGQLGGSHGGGPAKTGPSSFHLNGQAPNGPHPSQAGAGGGQLGGSHGGNGASMAKHAPGTGSQAVASSAPNGALGGAHGGASMAKVPIGGSSASVGNLVGGQLGGIHGPNPLAAHGSVDASALNSWSQGVAPTDVTSGWTTQRGLGAAGLLAAALARRESRTWDGLPLCRSCGREPETAARYCGYCGEALDPTLY
jgi:hypothetical protein